MRIMKKLVLFTIAALFLVQASQGIALASQTRTKIDRTNIHQNMLNSLAGPDSLPDTAFVEKEHLHRQKGYCNNTQLSIGVRVGMPVISVSTVNGYQFSRNFSLGLGVAYCRTYVPLWTVKQMFTTVGKSKTSVGIDEINVFIEPIIFFGKQKASPIAFFILDFGYSFFLSSKEQTLTSQEKANWRNAHNHAPSSVLIQTSYRGGLFVAPGFGLKTFLTRNLSLNFSLQLNLSRYIRNETEDLYQGFGVANLSLYPMFNIGIGF